MYAINVRVFARFAMIRTGLLPDKYQCSSSLRPFWAKPPPVCRADIDRINCITRVLTKCLHSVAFARRSMLFCRVARPVCQRILDTHVIPWLRKPERVNDLIQDVCRVVNNEYDSGRYSCLVTPALGSDFRYPKPCFFCSPPRPRFVRVGERQV